MCVLRNHRANLFTAPSPRCKCLRNQGLAADCGHRARYLVATGAAHHSRLSCSNAPTTCVTRGRDRQTVLRHAIPPRAIPGARPAPCASATEMALLGAVEGIGTNAWIECLPDGANGALTARRTRHKYVRAGSMAASMPPTVPQAAASCEGTAPDNWLAVCRRARKPRRAACCLLCLHLAHLPSRPALTRPPSRDLMRHGCYVRAYAACSVMMGGHGPCQPHCRPAAL